MSPRVAPKNQNQAAEVILEHARQRLKAARIDEASKSPYSRTGRHSWVIDSAVAALGAADMRAQDRLKRFEYDRRDNASAHRVELRAITTGTLGGLVPAVLPPYVAEAVAYGVRSGAPLAAALERLDLPPVGMNVPWAKVTTGAVVTNQTAENAALTASPDEVVASATDPIQTIGAYADFSAQSRDLSGGWLDIVLGYELGAAFGARLEQQLWAGTGASGQLKGFTVMTGNSSSTVSGQTLPLIVNKISDQFQQVFTNLGQAPNIVAMAPRRYAMLEAATGALGLEASNLLPVGTELVISPAAPLTLGAGTEDWILLLNKASTPLVRNPDPIFEFHQQGPSAGSSLTFRWLIYAYVALGVSRRPEGVGLVKGATPPVFT